MNNVLWAEAETHDGHPRPCHQPLTELSAGTGMAGQGKVLLPRSVGSRPRSQRPQSCACVRLGEAPSDKRREQTAEKTKSKFREEAKRRGGRSAERDLNPEELRAAVEKSILSERSDSCASILQQGAR